jgi:hypothetical protein
MPTHEETLREALHRYGVPSHTHDAYVNYILHGYRPGHFLLAVLMNDLKEACGRADEENRAALYQHVQFLYNFAPGPCWGSVEAVTDWIGKASIERANAEASR